MESNNIAGGSAKTMTDQLTAAWNAGHPGVTTSINQAGLPESFECIMRESRKINAGDTNHQVIIGKSRDGMSGFAKSMPAAGDASRATSLLRRI